MQVHVFGLIFTATDIFAAPSPAPRNAAQILKRRGTLAAATLGLVRYVKYVRSFAKFISSSWLTKALTT